MGEAANPYQAPREDADVPEAMSFGDGLIDATSGTRFANLLIDYFLTMVLVVVGVMILGPEAFGNFITYPLMLGYYVFFESVFSATPGKMITRTRVVALDGSKPSFGQVLGRTLSRFVPFEPFSFFGRGARGWHDRWSKTRVVRV